MPQFLLQRSVDKRWEEVDDYTIQNRKNALADDGDGARYTQAFVVIQDNGTMQMSGHFSPNDIQWLLRFAGQKSGIETASVVGGMLLEPDMIRFRIRGKKLIHVLKTGETYKLVA